LTEEIEEEKEHIDYRHINQWILFLMIWLILIKVYSGHWLMDILQWVITLIFVVWFFFDVKKYFRGVFR